MAKKNEIVAQMAVSPLVIQQRIHEIRGEKVMLDRDLAELYGVVVRVLNQAVKRNIERFPEDFVFQLDNQELANYRSQFVIYPEDVLSYRRAPYAFTEQGVAMLSSVLRSKTAINVNIQIMRAFTAMRRALRNMEEAILRQEKVELEVEKLRNYIEEVLHDQNDTNEELRQEIDNIYTAIGELSVKVAEPKQAKHKPVGYDVIAKEYEKANQQNEK